MDTENSSRKSIDSNGDLLVEKLKNDFMPGRLPKGLSWRE